MNPFRNVARRRAVLAAVVASAAVVLGGCSTASSDTAGDASGGSTPVTLAIATQDLNIGYPYATLPLAMGWFEEEGLDVEIITTGASAQTSQALVAGQADLGVMTPDSAVIARADSEIPLRNIYPFTRYNDYQFAVLPDSEIESVADLGGRTVGQLDMGSGGVPIAHAYYEDAGLQVEDVSELAVGYGSSAASALTGGQVDAVIGFSGMWPRLQNEGFDFRMLPRADWQANMYGFSLYGTDDFIADNANVVEGIGRAISKSMVFLKANPEAGVRIFWEQYPDRAPADTDDPAALAADMAILEATLDSMGVTDNPADFAWGSQDPANWDFHVDFLSNAGLLEGEVAPEDLFDNSFVDAYNDFDHEAITKQATEWSESE